MSLLSGRLLTSILVDLVLAVFANVCLVGGSLTPLRIVGSAIGAVRIGHLSGHVTLSSSGGRLRRLTIDVGRTLSHVRCNCGRRRRFVDSTSRRLEAPVAIVTKCTSLLYH